MSLNLRNKSSSHSEIFKYLNICNHKTLNPKTLLFNTDLTMKVLTHSNYIFNLGILLFWAVFNQRWRRSQGQSCRNDWKSGDCKSGQVKNGEPQSSSQRLRRCQWETVQSILRNHQPQLRPKAGRRWHYVSISLRFLLGSYCQFKHSRHLLNMV